MGHSFGGLIVERTVAHTMRTLQGQNVRPPWDLALILNPASDAVLARQLVASLDSLYRYDPHSRSHNPKDRVFYTSAARDSESGAQAARRGAPEPAMASADWRSWQIRYAGDVDPGRYGGNVRVPFWIVRVPSHIINNHGGIWSDNNMALMATIFRLHRPLATTPVTVSGRRVLKETVPSAAKPYVLPDRPEL